MLVLFDRLRRTQKQEQSTEFNCPAGTSNSVEGSDSCNWICGDRTKLNTEDCDDGNISSGDGCSDACKIETGFTCTTDSPSVCSSNCGDGLKVLGYEECDDGNNAANDGCSNECKVEDGWNCQGGTISSKDKCYVVCGDELKIQNEECDDGNIINGDGCSSDCKVEDGFICTRYDSESADDCNDICGDGRVFDPSNDFCDDSNIIDGDGCSHDCFVESGWICTGGNAISKDICQTVCGDGVLVTASEQCDDGNILNKDGCDSNCKIEPNCYCNMNPNSTGNEIHPDSICTEVCGDGKNLGLRKCDDGGLENGDGCNSNCEVENGFECSGGSFVHADACIEICGDGLDFEKHECDDGDKDDGDGCSSTCEIEQCFECKGGTKSSPDKCIPLNITSELKKTSVPNEYDVAFSIDMIQKAISLKDLLVNVYSKFSIVVTWTARYVDSKTLRITLITNSVLIGDEIVSLKFINYKVFRGQYGGCLVSTEIKTSSAGNLIKSEEAASSFSIFAQYGTYFGILVTLMLVLIGGGSFEILWALINSMQIISYLPLMTPFFPKHVQIMFEVLKFSNMNFSFLSDIFKSMVPLNFSQIKSYNEVFTKNGIENPLFLENCASILCSLISYFGIFLISIILYKVSCWTKMKNLFSNIASSFIFNNFLRFITEGYLELIFGSFLNVYSFRLSSSPEKISFAFSAIFMLFLTLFPFFTFALIYDNRKNLIDNETYVKRYGTMFKHLKHDGAWYKQQFYPAFLVRRLVFAISLIALEGIPEIQCNIFILSALLTVVYLTISKPFKLKVANLLMIVNEISILLISMMQIIFNTNSKTVGIVDIVGWMMISVCGMNILINFCISLITTIQTKLCTKVASNNENIPIETPSTNALPTTNRSSLNW